MINPTPVTNSRTPYADKSRANLPKSISVPNVKSNKRFNWKRLFLFSFFGLILLSGAFVYYKITSIKNAIVIPHEGQNSSVLGVNESNINSSQFQEVGDGRFNLVIVGVGGANHPGGNLTDSIQVMSVDTLNRKVGITSIPRDLYVKTTGKNYAKINSVYSQNEAGKSGSGALAMRTTVGNVLGVSISNFLLIDFAGAKQLVDALGGIDVTVPTAISDPLFPDDKTVGYAPFYIKAGEQHMNGTTALKYSRSRETTSDFDRSARQQLVISAMKKKALSAGTLANPTKVSGILDALGQHIKTDMQPDDLRKFISIYKDISSENSETFVLDTSAKLGLLTSSSGTSAGYISYPLAGQGDFSGIHQWFQKNNPDPLLIKESPTVSVIAGTGTTTKQVQEMVLRLNDYGYKAVIGSGTYNQTTKGQTEIFDSTKGKKPITKNYLNSLLGATTRNGSPLKSGSDFEIIYSQSTKTIKK